MINSGLAVLRALYVLEEQTENPRLKKIIARCGTTSKPACRCRTPWPGTRSLSTGCTWPWCGPARRAALSIRHFYRLATQLEKQDSLRRTIKSAMTYPILIAVFAILVMIGMLLFIIPIFANMYDDLGGQLPSLTRMMMSLSNMLKGYWFIVFPVILLLSGVSKRLKNTEQGRRKWDRIKLKLPMKIGPSHPEDRRGPVQPHVRHAGGRRCADPSGHRDHRQDLG